MKIKTIIATLAAATLSQLAFAGPAADALLEKLKKTYPNIAFTQVNETPAPGVYEAVFSKDMLYVDATGTYFFPTMVNMVTRQNISEERRAELNKLTSANCPSRQRSRPSMATASARSPCSQTPTVAIARSWKRT